MDRLMCECGSRLWRIILLGDTYLFECPKCMRTIDKDIHNGE
jgi:hypothetical protein